MYRYRGKRLFDIFFALSGILVLVPVFIMIAGLVKVSSKGPILFKQSRVGMGFSLFTLYKFRSMRLNQSGPLVTSGNDPRITKIGSVLRKTKMDELPQLWNVLKGEMSFVGPRPEAEPYVAKYREDYVNILQVRPGITDDAALVFRHEEAILARYQDPEKAYIEEILPQKIALYKEYVETMSLWTDLKLIFRTLGQLFVSHKEEKAGEAGV